MQPSRTRRLIPVDVLTVSYRIVGKMMVSNTGIIGSLNNPNTSFMEIYDARLARIHQPTKLADHFEMVRLTQDNILVVSLNRREDIGHQALARGGYATTKQYEILVTMQNYEIEGTIEWQGRFDFRVLMVEGIRDFVPIYNVTVAGVLFPSLKIQSPAMLFNRKQVDLLGLLSQRQDKRK